MTNLDRLAGEREPDLMLARDVPGAQTVIVNPVFAARRKRLGDHLTQAERGAGRRIAL